MAAAGRAVALAAAALAAALAAAHLTLTSPALRAGGTFGAAFTCSGANTSPPLRWTAPPHRTRSFALAMRDTSTTPVFLHWAAWGISASRRGLARGAHAPREGENTFGQRGYGGPCPPPGERHRYVLILYALARPLTLRSGAAAPAFESALRRARILARATLVAYYER